jgi:hypothetical protein
LLPAGLPDGILSDQKYQFWYILEGLGVENSGIFLAIGLYFMNICLYFVVI